MNKNKLAFAVLSTTVFASMASAAYAAPAGIYIGGDIDEYYSFTTLVSGNNLAQLKEKVKGHSKDTVFVDSTGKAATFYDIALKGKAGALVDLDTHPEVFGDSAHDQFSVIGKDGQPTDDVVVPIDGDLPTVSDVTSVVADGKVTISGKAANATTAIVTLIDSTGKSYDHEVAVKDGKFTYTSDVLAAGDYSYEVVAANDSDESEVYEGTFKVEGASELKVDSVNAINLAGTSVALEGSSIAATSDLTLTFSEELDDTTVNANNIYLTQNGVKQLAALSYDKATKSVTITAPVGGFASGKPFVLTIGTGLKATSGHVFTTAKTVNFTVSSNPVVLNFKDGATELTNGSVLSGVGASIDINFNEALDVNTVNTTSVKVYNVTDGVYVASTVTSTNATSFNVAPNAALDANKKYRVIVKADVADLAGEKLTRDYTLDVFSTGSVTLANFAPADGDVGVYNKITSSGGNSAFRYLAQFDADMDATTINAANVTLTETATGKTVDSTVTYEAGSRYVNIVPKADLAENTNYTVTFGAKIKSVDGLAIAKTVKTFTTGDFSVPTVVSVVPATGTTNVGLTDNIVLNFSEKMAAITADTDYVLKNETDGANVTTAGWVLVQSDDKKSFTLTPAKSGADVLKPNKTYSLTLKKTIKDLANNTLTAEQKVMFNTVAATAPAVTNVTSGSATGTVVAADSTGLGLASKLYFNFPVALNTATVNATNVVLEKYNGTSWVAVTGGGAPTVGVDNNDKSIVLNASTNNFVKDTQYRVRITNAVKDVFNTPVASEYVFGFLTGLKPTASTPQVEKSNTFVAASLATGVDKDTQVKVTIGDDTAVLASSVNANNVYLKETATGEKVAASVTYAGTTATITPDAELKAGTQYTIVVSGVKDQAGNTIADTSWNFTTVNDGAAHLLSITPADNSFDVATDGNITIAFDSKMKTPVLGTDIIMTVDGSAFTEADAYLSADGKTVTIDPTYSLLDDKIVTVTVKSTYQAANNVALGGSDQTVGFRTSTTYVKQKVASVQHVEAGTTGLADDLLVITLSAPLTVAEETDINTAAANFAPYFAVKNGSVATADVSTVVADGDTITITFGNTITTSVVADNFTTIGADAPLVDGNGTAFATTAVKVTKP